MATKCVINKATMTGIADAIRAKGGASAQLLPSQMAGAIEAIPSGGGDAWQKQPWFDDGDIYIWIYVDRAPLAFRLGFCRTNSSPMTIDWGDGASNTLSARSTEVSETADHIYGDAGVYVIHIGGYATFRTYSRMFSTVSGGGWDFMSRSSASVRQVETGDERFYRIGGGTNNGIYNAYNLRYLKTRAEFSTNGLIFCPSLESIETDQYAFSGTGQMFSRCINLRGILTVNGLANIPNNAFDGCESLEGIVIPNSVEKIGNRSFSCCTSVSEITIPDSVITVGESAFRVMRSLVEITIGRGVTSIGNYAFSECVESKTVSIKAVNPPTLGTGVFTASIEKIIVPAGSLNAYKTATNWSAYANKMQESEEF